MQTMIELIELQTNKCGVFKVQNLKKDYIFFRKDFCFNVRQNIDYF
jgi:hypothetical protein